MKVLYEQKQKSTKFKKPNTQEDAYFQEFDMCVKVCGGRRN